MTVLRQGRCLSDFFLTNCPKDFWHQNCSKLFFIIRFFWFFYINIFFYPFSASSTDLTNPATGAIVNLQNIEKIILEVEDGKNGTKKKIFSSRKKPKKIRPDTSNGYNGSSKHYQKFEQQVHSSKGKFLILFIWYDKYFDCQYTISTVKTYILL